MGCNCGKPKCDGHCGVSPAVLQINNPSECVLFHRVEVPASMGDSTTNPPKPGAYKNTLLYYKADGEAFLYSSDGIPTKITGVANDYACLENKPQINGVTLEGNKSLNDIGVTDAINNALEPYTPTSDLAEVAFSGDYNDLSNKPTIGNATLTIQKNGTAVDTFTANATSNKTINITVPTTAADVSALPASTKYGASIAVSINTTNYKVTTTLKDQDGNTLGTAQVIDLPLESVVVNGSYDSTNKKIVLTLQSGSTIDIPVADLVAGLQSEITSTNKLSSDLVDDTNHAHKFVTAAQITKLNGIAAGAEVNVQSDWSVTDTTSDAFIKNKPTIPAAQVNSDWNAASGVAQILNKPTLAAVATSGSYDDLTDKPDTPSGLHVFHMGPASVGNTAPIYHDYEKTNQVTLAQFIDAIASGPVQIYMEYDTRSFLIYYVDPIDAFIPDPPQYIGTLYANFGLRNPYGLGVKYFSWYEGATAPTYDSYDPNQSDWNETSPTNSSYIKNKPSLATVATSGSYNDLSNKPTIPAAQVNSDWNAASGVTQILNKPSLATVATSGSYNDLTNKPTIPTVNNATLTIQKNGTNVQTFTANQSTNATANITVPTKTSDLTNDSSFVTSSGTVAKADRLTTPRTIAISGGATGTATSFSGASNISIPITGMYETYLNWGNQNLSGSVSCVDAALSEEFSANRLAYMDASKITVEYSRDGGSTWTDYGLTAAQKTGLVTTSQAIYTGGTDSNAASNYRVRVNLNPTNPYMVTRKLFIYISTGGVSNAQVLVERKPMGGTNYETVTTATISGWSGWNSIPINITFGGTTSWSNSDLRLTFSYSGKSTSSPNAQLQISKIRLYGETMWRAPSNLATNGHLYTYDTSQNATFPANVSVTGSLQHGNYTYTLPNKNGTVAMTSDIPAAVTVDSALSSTSTNPVQNKVINTALNGKQASLSTAQLNAANSGITSAKVSTYDGYASTIARKANSADVPVITLTTTDPGEGSTLAANTFIGVYN